MSERNQQLADIDEPLELADGTLVHPNGRIERRKARGLVTVPSNGEAQEVLVNTRRTLADLPAKPQTTNTVSVVLSYYLYGLGNTEIALATKLTEQQVGQIMMSAAFTQMREAIVQQIIDADAQDVQSFLKSASKGAATHMVQLMTSDDPDIALRASKEVLDRAGHSAAQLIRHEHNMQGTLLVEVRKGGQLPTIELENVQ